MTILAILAVWLATSLIAALALGRVIQIADARTKQLLGQDQRRRVNSIHGGAE